MDEQHLYDVVSVLKDKLILDINIAGIGGRVEELSTVADNLRNMFLDGQMQSIYDVNIHNKNNVQKIFRTRSKSSSTRNLLQIYTRRNKNYATSGFTNPIKHTVIPNDEQTHPCFWSTEFMYEDAPKYVQSHQIINEGLNKFKGMKCELGFDSLNIDMNGEVVSSWCGARNFGNINQLDNWDIQNRNTLSMSFAIILNDISITKTL